ncbi:MAG: hypothetical protein U9P71_01990 [Campylobacterota bacterium]|nr:hypothetical protein [Campylobacterota bacterium]
MKKIVILLSCAASLALSATNEELEAQINSLKAEVASMKSANEEQSEALLNEVSSLQESIFAPVDSYESVSSMGQAASKVYHAKNTVSIGGYGEYKFKKYSDFKNYKSDTANETRNKSEFNIVRFVPYIGFKFNDWIVMNTEIEFENGGARSDATNNYKYAIVEFSYLDFMFEPEYALRVGHILVPMGLTNLNHEPVAYLTTERPVVETFIIPSTWHTNGALMHGKIDAFEYYGGVVTSPDAGDFVAGRFIQQGRLGARQFTDDFSLVFRGQYAFGGGLDIGGSFLYGDSSVLAEDRPGASTGNTTAADISITMAEIHATYRNNGFDIKAMAAFGSLGDDVAELGAVPDEVNGQYITIGYDVLHAMGSSHKVYGVLDFERLDMDASSTTENSDNHRFYEYSIGVAYFPDPKVVVKADYSTKDYASGANLADENCFTVQAGFIF